MTRTMDVRGDLKGQGHQAALQGRGMHSGPTKGRTACCVRYTCRSPVRKSVERNARERRLTNFLRVQPHLTVKCHHSYVSHNHILQRD